MLSILTFQSTIKEFTSDCFQHEQNNSFLIHVGLIPARLHQSLCLRQASLFKKIHHLQTRCTLEIKMRVWGSRSLSFQERTFQTITSVLVRCS